MYLLKRLIPAVAVFTLSGLYSVRGQVTFVKAPLDSLKAKAVEEQKLIFVDAYTDWCYWCKVMDKNTFSDSALGKYMNKRFLNTKLEMEKETDGQMLAMKYTIKSFPTFLILDEEGIVVYRITGYMPPKEFLAEIQKGIDRDNQLNQPGYSKRFDRPYPEFYRNAFVRVKDKLSFPDSATVNGYLAEQSNVFDEINWAVLKAFYWHLNPEITDRIFKEKDFLVKQYGKDEVEQLMLNILYRDLNKAVKNHDEEQMKITTGIAFSSLREGKEVAERMQIHYYLETKNWPKLKEMMNMYMSAKGGADATYINDICWKIYEGSEDKELLSAALVWIQDALRFDNQYNIIDTYAALLFKNGQLDKAESYANKAIFTGKESGQDVKATEELLKKIKQAKKKQHKKK